LDVLYHVDILLVIDVDFHISFVVQWNEHKLFNPVNKSFKNLTYYSSLFNEYEVTHCFKFNVAKHTKEHLFKFCCLLNLPEVSVNLRFINTIITYSVQLELELFWIYSQ
jgi:hypothetical protein